MENTTPVDIDLDTFSKEELINLIIYSNNRNITFNEAIVQILSEYIKREELTTNT